MEAAAGGVKVVGPKDGQEGFLGSIGVRFMIDGSEAGERLLLARRASDVAARDRRAAASAHARG